jgi:hypothetical protein
MNECTVWQHVYDRQVTVIVLIFILPDSLTRQLRADRQEWFIGLLRSLVHTSMHVVVCTVCEEPCSIDQKSRHIYYYPSASATSTNHSFLLDISLLLIDDY